MSRDVRVSARFPAAVSHPPCTVRSMSHSANRLAVIDLETTGLEPYTGLILEIGVVIIDETLTERGGLAVLVDSPDAVAWAKDARRRDGDGGCLTVAEEMHLRNGLIDELLAGAGPTPRAGSVEAAAAVIAAGLDAHGICEPVPMVGSSVRSLDAPFLEVHAPALAARFTHRTIDASALTEFAFLVDRDGLETVMAGLPGSNHRTLGDCRRSLEILRRFATHYGIGAVAAASVG